MNKERVFPSPKARISIELYQFSLSVRAFSSFVNILADYLSKCSPTSKEQLNQCLYTAIEELRPLLARGVPEINLKPLEPLYIDRIEFIDRQGGRDIRANFTNINVYGMSNFITKNLE